MWVFVRRSLLSFRSVCLILMFLGLFLLSRMSFFFFSSRRRHTSFDCDWSSDVCSSDLTASRTETSRSLDRARNKTRRGAPNRRACGAGHPTLHPPEPGPAWHPNRANREIGRASCRERV